MSYVLTAAMLERPRWVLEPRVMAPALLWIVFGLVLTVIVELWATDSGRWTYAPAMATVFGIGLLPLAQWVAVPTLTLIVFRITLRRHP